MPGVGLLAIGSPLFPRASVALAHRRHLIDLRRRAGCGPGKKKHSVALSPAALLYKGLRSTATVRPPWTTWCALSHGADLGFQLGPRPNRRWGSSAAAAPPSFGPGQPDAEGRLHALTLAPTRAGALWALALLTALGAAMRFASLDVQSFHHDEVITAMRVIPGSFGDMMHAVKSSESNPPLYYVLAWGWAKAFGTDEVGLRSLSALLGTATVPLAYCIGAELAHRRAGLIAAALVAVNPMLIWYSQEARSYALLVFFCAASLLFFARALRTRSGRDLALWALCLGAGPLQPLLRRLRRRRSRRSGCWSPCAPAGERSLPAVAVVVAAGLALLPLISAQVNPTHIGWIEEGLLSTRFLETGVSFLIGETGHVIAEPPRERYALLPVILFALALLLVAACAARAASAAVPCSALRWARASSSSSCLRRWPARTTWSSATCCQR